ncbi:carbohydrate ABC transporter substrate-binding protein [Elioraea sp. Yellowstone]|jgi:multiple sugar transport system substrate-binding protein|uniref:ABC transporter substrate-binding protein n=1 Tax=Elioraea sp. Yellowstone TaxID=2592070 RepID=UPI00115018AC|nr:ABC transporter substrate-binding protein [Elioraea sp. Yellowstone]TQF83777.1 carbohydrate ABC transporter substrate-binding protein [Elioraea sp. Yellowstone]
MVHIITRRGALALGAGAAAMMALREEAAAQQIPTQPADPPRLPIESGASLRVIRPARFVAPDEEFFRANTEKFSKQFNVPVRVDFVGWEDIRPQTAVLANTGTGPDVVIGWSDDPHIYADKLHDLSDVAEYLGKKYGGWQFLAEKYGKRHRTNNWIAIPLGGSTGPLVYRISAVKEAGFDKIPEDHAGFLQLCKRMKEIGKPAGFALGNAVGDGNGTANWLTWSFNSFLTDEDGKVAINQPATIRALEYLKELYPTFVPGTLSWLDPTNNRAYAAQECWMTPNGVSLYFALKNDPNTRHIAEDTDHANLPRGLAPDAPQSATIINAMVFKSVRYPNAAKAYIQFMMEAEQYNPWLTACLGYWSHPLKAYDASAVWTSDPKIALYRRGLDYRYWSGYKGPITAASGTAASEYVLVQMYASVAAGQATPQQAVQEAERRARRIFR